MINARALSAVKHPIELLASLNNFQILSGLALILLIILFNYFFIRKLVFLKLTNHEKNKKIYSIIFSVLLLIMIPIFMRGGIQQIPINESSSWYSTNSNLNAASTNPIWYLAKNIGISINEDKNIFDYYPDDVRDNLIAKINPPSHELIPILKTDRPNIVFIILESWTSDIIKPLDGDSNTTPFFNSLVKEGLLFNQIYASGRRTEQMFPSIFSGFPAQPYHSIITNPEKSAKLPFITKEIIKENYSTSFFYGGELGFANIKTYLYQSGIDKLFGKNEYKNTELNSKWGAHDEFVFSKQLGYLKNEHQPFMSAILTLSTHEPFEVPGKVYFKGNDAPSQFRNSAKYTDNCLKNYFEEARKYEWYKNTIFIITADHGHILPRKLEYNNPGCYRIPLLFVGGALKDEFINTINSSIGNQNDIAATLLAQLKIKNEKFLFSNDLLNSKRVDYAYLNMDDSYGWKTKNSTIVYNTSILSFTNEFTSPFPIIDSTDFFISKAYLQTLYKSYLRF